MNSTKLRKRIYLGLFMGCILFHAQLGFGQEEENLKVLDHWIGWSDSKNMLVHHLNQQAFDLLDARDQKIAGLRTKSDWIKRQEEVSDVLRKVVGTFPEKTPLNANVLNVVKKDGYTIEKVVFQSMPGFYVTGALYIPNGRKGKTPAILFTSGHTMEAFRYNSYQTLILNLVKKGFIVFGIDPLGQGERIQCYDESKKASALGSMTREHSYLGNQCLISGSTVARYFIWDGIRAIDYLLTRREVDPSRLGITGQSGGGNASGLHFCF